MTDWLDAHTHLDSEDLYRQKDAVIQRALQAGVRRMLLVNSEATPQSFERTLESAGATGPIQSFAAVGIHPHHAGLYKNDDVQSLLQKSLSDRRVIALGEIGLDFFYDFSPRDQQREALSAQLHMARERNLPVVIHCRDAYGHLAEMLREQSLAWKGMIHCFTGNRSEAETLLDLGFYISFSGIVTFRNAGTLREAALAVPPDRILIETDAPYLAPVPMRGKPNEPAFVAYTGQFLAGLRSLPLEDFSKQIFSNFAALFGV